MSSDQVLENMIRQEIANVERRCGGKTRSRKQNTTRLGWICGLAIFIVLCFMGPGILFCAPLALYAVFVNGFKNNTQIKQLMELAKNNPAMPIDRIVAEDCYVVGQQMRFSGSNWLIALILAAAVGLGIPMNLAIYSGSGTTSGGMPQKYLEYEKPTVKLREDGNYELIRYVITEGETVVTLADSYKGIPIVSVGEYAFYGLDTITEIYLPDTITEIDSYAFKDCTALEKVVMSDGVTAIGGEAFMNCTSLTEFTVPSGVTEIRGNTFEGCTGLTSVTLHDGITAIHAAVFKGCSKLDGVILPSGITEIRANTFENCVSLTQIHIPEGVTRIAAHAFRGCSDLAAVTIPSTVTEIGSSAFRNCDSLTAVSIPQGADVNGRAFKDSPTEITYY